MKRKKRPALKPAGEAKCPRPGPRGVYRARRSREWPLWRLLEGHLDEFLAVYGDRFAAAAAAFPPKPETAARAARETVKGLLQAASGDESVVPGGVARLQTSGDRLDWHPHVHLLISWGVSQPDSALVLATDVPSK